MDLRRPESAAIEAARLCAARQPAKNHVATGIAVAANLQPEPYLGAALTMLLFGLP
jgi:hypothetical protein